MQLTVVMYHYVRELQGSRFPRLKARRLSEFRSQLDYLSQNYRPVSFARVLDAVSGGEALPERALLLTFDDGYREHYTHVFPLLAAVGVPAVFFPPARAVLQRELLDVHKLHAIFDRTSEAEKLLRHVETKLRELCREAGVEYVSTWQRPGSVRFDDGVMARLKFILQRYEPRPLREALVNWLFEMTVGEDAQTLAEEWYVSLEELREMRRGGMEIGGHGWDHPWWDTLSGEAQSQEIAATQELLSLCDVAREAWSFAYPYGSFSTLSARLLSAAGCRVAFTTEPRVADLARDDLFFLPRLDTNDFPLAPI